MKHYNYCEITDEIAKLLPKNDKQFDSVAYNIDTNELKLVNKKRHPI